MKSKICPRCKHKVIIINSNGQKYCSINCFKIAEAKWKKKYFKKYYQLHKEKMKLYFKHYRKVHKEEIKEYFKNHKEARRAYKKLYNMEYKQKHIKQINKNAKKYNKIKRKKNINFKLLGNLRSRLYHALKGKSKSTHTLELIGCSVEQLKQYIEKQFTKGMSWFNYGRGNKKWNIDHIKPCCKFNLTETEEQRICFHYTNLRPLWAIENHLKIIEQ